MKRTRKDGQLFYYKNIASNITLKAGVSELIFFKKKEESNMRNYEGESNPVTNGAGGRIIGVHAEFYAPSMGALIITPSTADILDSYAKVRNSGKIEIKVGNDTVHEDLLSTLLPAAPMLFKPEKFGTVNDGIYAPVGGLAAENQSPWILRSSQLLIPFQKPLPIKATESFELKVNFMQDLVIPANLAGYVIGMKMACEVLMEKTQVARAE